MIHHAIEQNTEEWMNLRIGKFTASSFSDLLMGKSTLGYNKTILKVVYQRMTKENPEAFSNGWMERGHELEPEAIRHYEGLTFDKVLNGGFFELDEWTGASPDGLIGNDGLLQIKCPAWNTHLSCLNGDKIPKEYIIQIQGEMMVTGNKWCDLMFYHPKLKPIITRFIADANIQDLIKIEIKTAIESAKNILNKLKNAN